MISRTPPMLIIQTRPAAARRRGPALYAPVQTLCQFAVPRSAGRLAVRVRMMVFGRNQILCALGLHNSLAPFRLKRRSTAAGAGRRANGFDRNFGPAIGVK